MLSVRRPRYGPAKACFSNNPRVRLICMRLLDYGRRGRWSRARAIKSVHRWRKRSGWRI
jgi:hypothetical protein